MFICNEFTCRSGQALAGTTMSKGMSLDSSPKSLTLLWQQVAKYRISRRCRSE